MEITVLQARTIVQSPIFTMRMPAATSYKFAKLAKLLRKEFQTSEEARMRLLREHEAVLRENEQRWVFLDEDGKESPEKTKAFNAEWQTILDQTLDIGHHFPMPLLDLEMSAEDLLNLDPLFLEPEEAEE